MPRWIQNYWSGDSAKEDRRLAILHNEIQTIEGHAQYLGPRKDCTITQLITARMPNYDLKKYRRPPFEALPCHRDIVVEIQGEEWVLEKEHEKWAVAHGDDDWREKYAVKEELRKKEKEAYYRLLRDI